MFEKIDVIEWGNLQEFDIIINATTLGLKENDTFGLDFSKYGENKFFYDVIYAPFSNEFSEAGSSQNNLSENGFNMFLYQAQKAFNIWHNIEPEINQELVEFLKN